MEQTKTFDIQVTKTEKGVEYPLNDIPMYGAFVVCVSDVNGTGSSGVFSVVANPDVLNQVNRTASLRGQDGQRIELNVSKGLFHLKHTTEGAGEGTYTYNVRIL